MKRMPLPIVAVVLILSIFLFLRTVTVQAAADLEAGINELAGQISKNMRATGKKKIAIVEFSDLNGNITAFGQFLAEELITRLFIISPGQFEVVERRQLMRVLQEQKLTMSGLLDAEAMESVGKILGIDAIVTGSITDLGNSVKVNARLIGVDTAKVFAVASTSIPKVGTVASLMEKKAIPPPVYSRNTMVSSVKPSPAFVSPRPTHSPFPSFQNSFLRVTVQSINMSKNKTVLSLVLRFENITKKDILLGVQGNDNGHVTLVDDKANVWAIAKITGIQLLWPPEYAVTSKCTDYRQYTVFTPHAKNTVVMIFKSEEASDGKIFSFGADLYRYIKDKEKNRYIKFSIGISDIRGNKREHNKI